MPSDLLRGRRCRRKLIYGVTSDRLAATLRDRKERAIVIPSYDYSRVERVKVALVAATMEGHFKEGEIVLCLAGRTGQPVDTMMHLRIGASKEERTHLEGVSLGETFHPQVVEGLIQIALEIGQEGFEGHAIGTIFVIGDSTNVLEKSRQILLNPFQGIPESERNVLDPRIRESIKRFAVLDGAFIVREDGVMLAAGRFLSSGSEDLKLPLGLGARHAAAAGISKSTQCLSLVVSQSSGAVRLFKGGHTLLELHQAARRT